MGKKRKIQIKEPRSADNKIRFSFEYYDTEGNRKNGNTYCLRDWSEEQLTGTLGRLKEISKKTWGELTQETRVYHFFPVIWDQTIEKEYPYSGVREFEPYHFALLGVNKQLARVYGAYSEGVFYVVWFDLDHKIWPVVNNRR